MMSFPSRRVTAPRARHFASARTTALRLAPIHSAIDAALSSTGSRLAPSSSTPPP
jgi:hypothetical protein